jgi:hypothetical protein
MSEARSIWGFMQRPSIINLDATYRRVCVVKKSNNWLDWRDLVIYFLKGLRNLNRYKIAIHIVYLLSHSMIRSG